MTTCSALLRPGVVRPFVVALAHAAAPAPVGERVPVRVALPALIQTPGHCPGAVSSEDVLLLRHHFEVVGANTEFGGASSGAYVVEDQPLRDRLVDVLPAPAVGVDHLERRGGSPEEAVEAFPSGPGSRPEPAGIRLVDEVPEPLLFRSGVVPAGGRFPLRVPVCLQSVVVRTAVPRSGCPCVPGACLHIAFLHKENDTIA